MCYIIKIDVLRAIMVLLLLLSYESCLADPKKFLDLDSGYIVYCPCMGRFGNQADHFLGALGFAKGINRTLILPPWVEYQPGAVKSIQIPFDTYFKVAPIQEFHSVITMEEFMNKFADKIWPAEKRIAFCYMARHDSSDCNAKQGNPFGPFWDTYGIDFVGSQFYRPLSYDVYHQDMGSKWNQKFPVTEWPVLAFAGAPASFPVQSENVPLQKYLIWNDSIVNKAKQFIKSTLPRGRFVGIHLRNGIDWERACEHVEQSPNLFAAPQCLGYKNENGVATKELCLPSNRTIIKQLKRSVKSVGAKSIFVASDNDHMISELSAALKKMKITVHKLDSTDPHLDLAILGLSNHFIANCVSSFSSFVVRQRQSIGFPVLFWAFPLEKLRKIFINDHDEL